MCGIFYGRKVYSRRSAATARRDFRNMTVKNVELLTLGLRIRKGMLHRFKFVNFSRSDIKGGSVSDTFGTREGQTWSQDSPIGFGKEHRHSATERRQLVAMAVRHFEDQPLAFEPAQIISGLSSFAESVRLYPETILKKLRIRQKLFWWS